MSAAGLLLGVINVAIAAGILVLIGAIIVMVAKWFSYTIDWNVQRMYLLVVLLIVLYMIVALLLGLPTWRVVNGPDDQARMVREAWLHARALSA